MNNCFMKYLYEIYGSEMENMSMKAEKLAPFIKETGKFLIKWADKGYDPEELSFGLAMFLKHTMLVMANILANEIDYQTKTNKILDFIHEQSEVPKEGTLPPEEFFGWMAALAGAIMAGTVALQEALNEPSGWVN